MAQEATPRTLLNTVLEFVVQKTKVAALPVFLGGHSSGGGLVVNYATWSRRRPDVAAYALLSPQLGYLAKVDHPTPSRVSFARVNVAAFIVNGVSGGLLLGHNHAVQFAYTDKMLAEEPGMVKSNTVNMANAITPTSPFTLQFRTFLPICTIFYQFSRRA